MSKLIDLQCDFVYNPMQNTIVLSYTDAKLYKLDISDVIVIYHEGESIKCLLEILSFRLISIYKVEIIFKFLFIGKIDTIKRINIDLVSLIFDDNVRLTGLKCSYSDMDSSIKDGDIIHINDVNITSYRLKVTDIKLNNYVYTINGYEV